MFLPTRFLQPLPASLLNAPAPHELKYVGGRPALGHDERSPIRGSTREAPRQVVVALREGFR